MAINSLAETQRAPRNRGSLPLGSVLIALFTLSAAASILTLLNLVLPRNGEINASYPILTTVSIVAVVLAGTLFRFVGLEIALDRSRPIRQRMTAATLAMSLMLFSTLLNGSFFWEILGQKEANRLELQRTSDTFLGPLTERSRQLERGARALEAVAEVAQRRAIMEANSGGTCDSVVGPSGRGPAFEERTRVAYMLEASSRNLTAEVNAFSRMVAELGARANAALADSRFATAETLRNERRRLLEGARTANARFRGVEGARSSIALELRRLSQELRNSPRCPDAVLATDVQRAASNLSLLVTPLPDVPSFQESNPTTEYIVRLAKLFRGGDNPLRLSLVLLPFIFASFVEVAIFLLSLLRSNSSALALSEHVVTNPLQLRLALEGRAGKVLSALLNEDLVRLRDQAFFALAVPPEGATQAMRREFDEKRAALKLLSTSKLVQEIDARSVWPRLQNWVLAVTSIALGTYAKVKLELRTSGRGRGGLEEIVVVEVAPEALASIAELAALGHSSSSNLGATGGAPHVPGPRQHGEVRPIDIFISYSSRERAIASVFAEVLVAEGFSVWWDPDLYPGETFDDVIQAHLGAARSVLVLWSARSVTSRWVRSEATFGLSKGLLVPAQIDNCELPVAFLLVQTIKLDGWRGNRDDPRWRGLVDSLRIILASPQPAPLRAPAQPRISEEMDLAFWSTVRDSTDPEELRAYLRSHPTGHFRELAELRAKKLARSRLPKGKEPKGKGRLPIAETS